MILELDVERARLEACRAAGRAPRARRLRPSRGPAARRSRPCSRSGRPGPCGCARSCSKSTRGLPCSRPSTQPRLTRGGRGSCSPPGRARAAPGAGSRCPGSLGRSRHDVDLAAEDRLRRRLFARLVELHRAEHVAVVGQRRRARMPSVLARCDQAVQAQRAVEHRVLRVDVEVNELGHDATRARADRRYQSGRAVTIQNGAQTAAPGSIALSWRLACCAFGRCGRSRAGAWSGSARGWS